MPNHHGWLMVADQDGGVAELLNHARSAAYLSNPDLALDSISICDVLDFGGCENYAMQPVCVPESGGWVDLPGVNGNSLTVAHAAAFAITGDISVVIRVEPSPDWTPPGNQVLGARWDSGSTRSWRVELLPTGVIRWSWSTSGGNTLTLDSTANLSAFPVEPLYIGIRFDVNNGAAGRTAHFWTSENGYQWDPLGTPVTSATATSLFAGTSIIEWGSFLTGTSEPFNGNVSGAVVYSGSGINDTPGGTKVFEFTRYNLEGVAPAATSFVAESGHTVTITHTGGTPAVVVPYVAPYDSWETASYYEPATDPAPWYMDGYPDSADALGFWIEEWTGLDDRNTKREMRRYGRDRGGAATGVITATERVMKLNVLLFARSEEAMMHLFRWFGAALSSVCASCTSESILIRDWCGDPFDPLDGVLELRNVALIEGLSWEGDVFPRGSCLIRRASFTLAAGDPCMYKSPLEPTVTPVADDLPQCLLDATYSLTRRPCRPSCSELTADCRAVWTWDAIEVVGANGPVIEFHNDHAEHAFPFRAVVYYDAGSIGVTPNPCGLPILGEIYVRPMPPSSFLRWDVAGRSIDYHDPTTGGWVPGWAYVDANDPPLRRYFVLPCEGEHHLVLEPATLCVERIGVVGNTFEWQDIIFTDPHYPDVSLTTVERVSCP